ncbi:hypothetical protein G7046_g386 [Stylonectria norvegica]|nr:hypothetical protein G7046_g386 [Stylonectria norvegica]
MCDFSCYGGTSDEWLAVEAGLPPPDGPEMELSELKRVTNMERDRISAEGMKLLRPQVVIEDYSIPTRDGSFVEARSYRPASLPKGNTLPLYIHLQGGGFMFGTLSSEDAICSRIALGSHVVALNINYRHTPEHKYPTQWNDAEDAFNWAHENMHRFNADANKVILGGISAGAWVAASLTLQKHLGTAAIGRPPLAGQVLMIPCLAHSDCYEPQLRKMKHPSVSSYRENEKAPMLSVTELRYFTDLLDMATPDPRDTKVNPGNASPSQVTGLPPTVLGVVGLDPLRDEGLLYAKMLTEAGVPTDVNIFVGMPHGFRSVEDKLAASERWDRVVEDGIRRVGWAMAREAVMTQAAYITTPQKGDSPGQSARFEAPGRSLGSPPSPASLDDSFADPTSRNPITSGS